LKGELIESLNHSMATAILFRGWLKSILKLTTKLFTIRPKIKEFTTLFQSNPFLLCHLSKLLMGIFLPSIT